MVTLKFTLTPEASASIHGALLCLARFSDTVSLEAKDDSLTFSALNLSKSAHAAVALDTPFFSAYEFEAEGGHLDSRFTCCMSNKALLSVFKSRNNDAKSSNITERCEVSFQEDDDEAKCRMIARNICSNGVIKTFRLTYESAEIMQALFDRDLAENKWAIRAGFLKENLAYFSQKVEQLDIFYEEGKMTFLSFTAKVVSAKNGVLPVNNHRISLLTNAEILKMPLKTTVILNGGDFEKLSVQEQLHIVVSVKDFRAVVLHAESIDTVLHAYYTSPGRPLQFAYNKGSMNCQFTLTTAGEYRGTTIQPAPVGAATRHRSESERASKPPPSRAKVMPPPPAPSGRRNTKTLGKRRPSAPDRSAETSRDNQDEPLFVPMENDDRNWDPPSYDNAEESLGWDASEETESLFSRQIREQEARAAAAATKRKEEVPETGPDESQEASISLSPTQRLSDIPRLW
ncbi:hypothetical protein BT63DRAFT_147837 [Microthyrium microscopicum]|uniref:DNA repair protein rad9 n=1 Tax=Microthyrium microscopicum TaxID=703497 RepID=A0A6A6UP16_9PEZI|nr:hypothetical protein BT63DRAFT_147837 [Microthyrium microscopicum]